MSSRLRWDLLDDRSFVGLVADLLRRRGFVDITVQGEGPDGGLDILASEIVTFSLAGSKPLRWGVQCKFSTHPARRQVTAADVHDVEGILRDDRFAGHELAGYMLVTNKRVQENVVRRLRGINQKTEFRTCIMDGQRIESLLAEEPSVAKFYFGQVIAEIERLVQEQVRENSEERMRGKEFRFEIDDLTGAEKSQAFYGDLSGTFDSAEGLLELTHDELSSSITGEYCWHSDQFVADLVGEYRNGILLYEFEWRRRELSGSGFHLVSPDGDHLEGLWFLGQLPREVPLGEVLRLGRRKSYWRT